ncbi:hypothetical protein ACFWFF_16460, partial [Streptomyces sp. NPDC060223]|uniref:hypothetical protein n=1 Tax=Streptomyces sp. NPDC060223 TaxID=3347077 RepID=UPI00365BB4CB
MTFLPRRRGVTSGRSRFWHQGPNSEELHRRRADGASRAVDEDVLPGSDARLPDEGQGVVRALGPG